MLYMLAALMAAALAPAHQEWGLSSRCNCILLSFIGLKVIQEDILRGQGKD